MKLPIQKEYFDLIKTNQKYVEWRDAHITFICEATGRTVKKKVILADIVERQDLPECIRKSKMFTDKTQIKFWLE